MEEESLGKEVGREDDRTEKRKCNGERQAWEGRRG